MLMLVGRLLLTAFLCVLLVGFGMCALVTGAQGGGRLGEYVFALIALAIAGLLGWAVVRLWRKSPPAPPDA